MLLVIMILVTACQPQKVVETVIVTQEVEKQVVVTKEVEKQVLVTPTSGPQAEAATIRIGGIGPLSAPGDVVGGIAMQRPPYSHTHP